MATGTTILTATSPCTLGDYEPAVLRHWNARADREELWFFLEFQHMLPVALHTTGRMREEAERIFGRRVHAVNTAYWLDPERRPVRYSRYWIAGPITEQEACRVKGLSAGPPQT